MGIAVENCVDGIVLTVLMRMVLVGLMRLGEPIWWRPISPQSRSEAVGALALTKQSRPLRQTRADAFSDFPPVCDETQKSQCDWFGNFSVLNCFRDRYRDKQQNEVVISGKDTKGDVV